jgi:hypothetical protein
LGGLPRPPKHRDGFGPVFAVDSLEGVAQFWEVDMATLSTMANSTPKQIRKVRKPVFGVLSVLAPFIGVLAVDLLVNYVSDTRSYARTHLVVYVLFGTPVCGLGFAVTTWVRRERYWLFPYLGIVLNVAYVFYIAQFLPGTNC